MFFLDDDSWERAFRNHPTDEQFAQCAENSIVVRDPRTGKRDGITAGAVLVRESGEVPWLLE